MARIDEFHTDDSQSKSSIFDVDISYAIIESKAQYWDSSSMYQVKSYFNYSSKEKVDMFDYMRLDLFTLIKKNLLSNLRQIFKRKAHCH